MLSWLTRLQARSRARKAWIKSLNCPQLAEEAFRKSYSAASKETTDELTGFAINLWQHWMETGQSEPDDCPDKHEPGFEE